MAVLILDTAIVYCPGKVAGLGLVLKTRLCHL